MSKRAINGGIVGFIDSTKVKPSKAVTSEGETAPRNVAIRTPPPLSNNHKECDQMLDHQAPGQRLVGNDHNALTSEPSPAKILIGIVRIDMDWAEGHEDHLITF